MVKKPRKARHITADQQYTYIYVPKMQNGAVSGKAADDVGVMFRLGSYSSYEQGLTAADDQAAVYPAKHISDSGDAATAVSNATGENGEYGILLACDGRILLKSGEKTYINVESDLHVQSNSGAITLESGSNKDITLNAGEGTGDIYIQATNQFEEVSEDSTKTYGGRTYVKVDKDEKKFYKANVYKIVHADTETHHMGGKLTTFLGGSMMLQLAAKFSLDLALYLAISVLSKIFLYGVKIEFGFTKVDIVDIKVEVKKGKVEHAWNKVGFFPVKAAYTGLKAVNEEIKLARHSADIKKKGVVVGSEDVVAKQRAVMAELLSGAKVVT